jgi:hypothetical protein
LVEHVRPALDLLAELITSGPDAFVQAHGLDALAIVREIEAALMMPLEGNLGHVVLWEQFLETPDKVFEALAGVLEGYVDRDTVLVTWLDEAVQRYETAAQERGS